MLLTIESGVTMDQIDELWRAAGGRGDDKSTLAMSVLSEKMLNIGQLHKAATTKVVRSTRRPAGMLVAQAAAQVAREELSVLVALWDSVRDAPDSEEAKERHEQVNQLMTNNWATILRMKAWLRLKLERWRKTAHENQRKDDA